MVSLCNKPRQLYMTPGFKEYFENPTHWERKAQSLETLIQNDATYQYVMEQIQKACSLQTDKLTKDSLEYTNLLPLW